MDLKEFISDTLTQICDGVKAAQSSCEKIGAKINPPIEQDRVKFTSNSYYWKYTEVRFKIALRSSDVENGKSGIGVLLANFTVGSTRETVQDLSSVTSVEFSVPVALPFSPVK